MTLSNKAITVSQAAMRQTTVRFSPALIKAVKVEALERGVTAQDIITEAICRYLRIDREAISAGSQDAA